jgi:putative tricarboxylic transport membrane protein
VSVLSPTLIFLLFDQVFRIRFPRGLLTNIWYG